MKDKINRKCHDFFLAWTAETSSTIKVFFIVYFVSDPQSEPEPASESIRSPESESEQPPPHDSAPLLKRMFSRKLNVQITFSHGGPAKVSDFGWPSKDQNAISKV